LDHLLGFEDNLSGVLVSSDIVFDHLSRSMMMMISSYHH
jgi:hypothetical protein